MFNFKKKRQQPDRQTNEKEHNSRFAVDPVDRILHRRLQSSLTGRFPQNSAAEPPPIRVYCFSKVRKTKLSR